jgi:hypothetical protein
MKEVSAKYLLQLAFHKIGEHIPHVCNKFSNKNAEQFMMHPDFMKLQSTNRLYVAQNQKGEYWFLLLEPIGSTERYMFANIRNGIKTNVNISKLEQRAGAHATKAAELWAKADAIKASIGVPQVAINFDELPF